MPSSILSPDDYEAAQFQGKENAPNRIIECISPVAFNQLGYPVHADTIKSVWRYLDTMHEGRTDDTILTFLGGHITPEEFDLLRQITRKVMNLSQRLYEKPMVATGSLLRALATFRQIRIAYPKPTTVLEIGPGCGYLGALLVLSGYGYISTDVAQGFYLYQNHLMEEIAPGKGVELVKDTRFLADIPAPKGGEWVHVPWWKFYTADPKPGFSVDCVTCNHALAEMHPNSLSYVIKFSRLVLSKKSGAFLFEGWGSTIHTPIWAVSKRFSDLGFVIPHMDIHAAIFAPSDGGLSVGAMTLPQAHRQDPVSFNATDYSKAGFEQLFHPPIYANPKAVISLRLTAGRDAMAKHLTIPTDQIIAMFQEERGQKLIESDDERFMNFVDISY